MSADEGGSGRAQEETAEKTAIMPMYRVILHNDDITPMDFVIVTLLRFFVSRQERAREIMITAHTEGQAVVCVLPLEHAEFKVQRAHEYARAKQYPLTFAVEPCE